MKTKKNRWIKDFLCVNIIQMWNNIGINSKLPFIKLGSFVFLLFITQLLLPRWAGFVVWKSKEKTLFKSVYNVQKYKNVIHSDSTTHEKKTLLFFATYQVPNIAHIIIKPRKSRNKKKRLLKETFKNILSIKARGRRKKRVWKTSKISWRKIFLAPLPLLLRTWILTLYSIFFLVKVH